MRSLSWQIMLAAASTAAVLGGCEGYTGSSVPPHATSAVPANLPGDAGPLIRERQLSPQDVTAALATYMPTGRLDDYVAFSSTP